MLLSVLPYWDVEASIAELLRCREKGHHGVCFLSKPYKIGLPPLHDPHWEPLFSVAQETGMSLNFHVGFQEFDEDDFKSIAERQGRPAPTTPSSAPCRTSATPRPSPI